jgi:hypothetical protein
VKNTQDFENVVQNSQDASHSFEYVELAWFDVNNFPEKFMPIAFPDVIKKYIENKNNFPTKYIT